MNSYLLNRSAGVISPREFARFETERRLHALQYSSVRFDGRIRQQPVNGSGTSDDVQQGAQEEALAHPAGVNALTIDKFEGRYLLSGGADHAISLWDLEAALPTVPPTHHPLSTASRNQPPYHKFGITDLHFYPFDSLAFTSSSYDHTLKLWSSDPLRPSASFPLGSIIYAHALSPIASHLLVACATQHPAVRLIDLRSGAATHSLTGHVGGAVLSVDWSPIHEHILASAGADGTVRFWDVRRSAGCLGVLDMDDSVGHGGFLGGGARSHTGRGKAHAGAANGVVWTQDGRFVVSTGHDEKIRVWDIETGANTLASFGPLVRNAQLSALVPCLAPPGLVRPGREVLFFPSQAEVLAFELFEGRLLKRLRTPGVVFNNAKAGAEKRGVKSKVTGLAWRVHEVELYSAHGDGSIRCWAPRTTEDVEADAEEREEVGNAEESRKRKRQVLDDLYRDLTRRRVADI
ncbi:hypothetical protein W97_05947 [Coniosporium apollinis CBS 100218]|uniref:Uncharacterized protein n=1 Tax=Coniosporium apollinis (strain CBS 100218) TaxID=1168221 RepID=R7YYH8_CONA1|nr:uncharacterized protein W97_05947 [Coniosporium apollinis CBS 100218]EON66701.1 hypothetical protein W97_05947 [Coniosporium apollinis CBS 100218]